MSSHTPERLRCEVCDMPTLGDTLCNLHYEEQEKMTHTPGPLTIKHGYRCTNLIDGPGKEIGYIKDEGHAAFIVRACNSHEAMLEALKGIIDAADDPDNGKDSELVDQIDWAGIRQAIAKAEGRA